MKLTPNPNAYRPHHGSADPRFCPRISTDTVRANGPRLGEPGVHQTDTRPGPRLSSARFQRAAGLPDRFIKD